MTILMNLRGPMFKNHKKIKIVLKKKKLILLRII